MNELIQERNQLQESADAFSEIKEQVRRLIEENAELKNIVKYYQSVSTNNTSMLSSLIIDKIALNRVIGQIGQSVIDGRLKGVGVWYRELRRIAE